MAFSATAYKLVHSRQPHAVSHLFPRTDWLSSRPVLLFNTENRSPVLCLAGRSKERWNLRIKNGVHKWSDKQWLLVGAVSYSAYCFLEGFIWGFLIQKVHESTTPFDHSDLQLECAATGDYSPLFYSMMGISPLISGRTYAVFVASMEFITYIIERLRGKKSYIQTKVAGGFGAGIILSLVTGMRAPASVIKVGVFLALVFALFIKVNPTRGSRGDIIMTTC